MKGAKQKTGVPARVGTIRQQRYIAGKPSTVYKALTDPKQHSLFTCAKATGKPIVGGKFTAWDGFIDGRYLDLQEGKRILAEWKTTEWPSSYPPSRLEFKFRQKGNGTQVIMVHSHVPSSQVKMYRGGWVDHYWRPLQAHFKKK